MDDAKDPPNPPRGGNEVNRRTLLVMATIAAAVGLTTRELASAHPAFAAAAGYNLPFTNLQEAGTSVPEYDSSDGWHTRPGGGHNGIDFNRRGGTVNGRRVYAIYPGVVNGSSYDYDLGHVVSVLQDDGRQSRYCHMQGRNVEQGTRVSAATVLGLIGNTGEASQGAHLHLEMRSRPGAPDIDPWPFLSGAPYANQVSNPPPPVPIYQEGDMAYVVKNTATGGIYTMAPHFIKHEPSVFGAEVARNVTTADDAFILLNQDQFNTFCDSLGIPRNKVPDPGRDAGKVWSLVRDIAAANGITI